MARKKDRSNKKASSGSSWYSSMPRPRIGIRSETKQSIGAILALVAAILFAAAPFGVGGVVPVVYSSLKGLLGVGYFLLPIASVAVAVGLFGVLRPKDDAPSSYSSGRLIGAVILLASGTALLAVIGGWGGLIGEWIAKPFVLLFDAVFGGVVLGALFIIGALFTLDTPLTLPRWSRNKVEPATNEQGVDNVTIASPYPAPEEEPPALAAFAQKKPEKKPEAIPEIEAPIVGFQLRDTAYNPPPLSLLEREKGKPETGDIKANANIIKRTLANFGIVVEMDEVAIGPTVTRFALKPAEGVRLQKILSLQNNLELALAASPIRIEAPIPGKSLVGIEVPNQKKATVALASLVADEKFSNEKRPLYVALGRDIAGAAHFANLAKMPHMLIAGATGSGKSVTIHAIISSLLYRNGPGSLRFIMIDPKRVELTAYNPIPHLLTPVITDPKKAILSLKWAAKEMERRYTLLESHAVRDIASYHENVVAPAMAKADAGELSKVEAPDQMPYIVIIIDELADIMTTYPRELEAAVVRLAQMSRAVGIHLILSTQRPSVNVITGLIKANVPARIALQVASQIDSRTILDSPGAENLLGAGDMLFQSADMAKPHRIQTAFISESEVKEIAQYIRKHNEPSVEDIAITSVGNDASPNALFSSSFEDNADDDLFNDAKQTVEEAGKASTSLLQRKLRVGYSRAARLMDILEEKGIIGPQDGARPREVLSGPRAGQSADHESE